MRIDRMSRTVLVASCSCLMCLIVITVLHTILGSVAYVWKWALGKDETTLMGDPGRRFRMGFCKGGPGRGFGRSWGFNAPLQERIEIYKQIWQLTVLYCRTKFCPKPVSSMILTWICEQWILAFTGTKLNFGNYLFILERGPVLAPPPLPTIQSYSS